MADGSDATADSSHMLGDATDDAKRSDASGSDGSGAFVCASSTLPCSSNTTLVTSCNGHCWVECDDQLDAAVAVDRCAYWGGELAEIDDGADESCVSTMLYPDEAGWLGLVGSPANGWLWTDGSAASYFDWDAGQPVDLGPISCAYMSTDTRWHDATCSTLFRFACRH